MAAALAAENRTEEQLEELKEVLELQEFYLSKCDAERIKHTVCDSAQEDSWELVSGLLCSLHAPFLFADLFHIFLL